MNDYSILTAVYGEQIDGIIGYSLLSRYIVKINYDSLYIDICSKGTMRYPKGGYLLKPTINSLPGFDNLNKGATRKGKIIYIHHSTLMLHDACVNVNHS